MRSQPRPRTRWIVLCLPLRLAAAQNDTGVAAVDSADVARGAWARAVSAYRAHDVTTARKEVERSVGAWPTQPAYAWGRVLMAAVQGDTVGVLDALTAYADLGLGRDLHADTTLGRFATLPEFNKIAARHDANRTSLSRSRIAASLDDSTFWPEGMDYDARTGRYYVASVRHGTIAELSPGTTPRELFARHQPGIGSVLGVRVDPTQPVLWATLAGIPGAEMFTAGDTAIAALIRVRIADGTIERRWELPAAARGRRHVLGDLAVGANGDVFITDSNEPFFYRLRVGADTMEAITNPLFRSLQGLAPTPNGRVLYLADYSHGLLRVDLATNAVTRLADADHSTSLGCDGIAWIDGAIVAVQNGVSPARLMRFVLDAEGRRIVSASVLDRNVTIADEPTIGAVVGREFVYVANSQWNKYSEDGSPRPHRSLTAPVLLAVPLP